MPSVNRPHDLPTKPPAKSIHRNGFDVSYFTVGEVGAPCIMLVHGLAANGLQFVEDARWFAEQGYFVIVPDLRGHGRSLCPDKIKPEDFTRAHLLQDLLEIAHAENIDQLTWVGNSLGGILALEAMKIRPELLRRVMVFGTAFSLKVPKWIVTLCSTSYRLAGTGLSAAIVGFMTSSHAVARKVVTQMLRDVQVEPMLAIGTQVSNYDLDDEARQYSGPILMLKADGDKQVNAANRSTLPNFLNQENFKLVELGDAGHCANLDQPEQFRELVRDWVQR